MHTKTTPRDIAIDFKERQVKILWQDGQTSYYPFDKLRQQCPCAVCSEMRSQNNADPLRILTPDQVNASSDLDPEKPVEVVGQYALQFFWADGHRTGIYTYTYLRQLGD